MMYDIRWETGLRRAPQHRWSRALRRAPQGNWCRVHRLRGVADRSRLRVGGSTGDFTIAFFDADMLTLIDPSSLRWTVSAVAKTAFGRRGQCYRSGFLPGWYDLL